MSILEKIIASKYLEVSKRKMEVSHQILEDSQYFDRSCLSLCRALLADSSSGVIAEFKRKSPSKGEFIKSAKTSEICPEYSKSGAAALSILTDYDFFGGSLSDIEETRAIVKLPVLRKDFIVDEYQILEAKSVGADVILLIAAALSVDDCYRLGTFAKSLGLEVLLEVHNKEELQDYSSECVDLLGVNNRNLKTFETKIELSMELASLIPVGYLKVAESGINTPTEVKELRQFGYQGFLIGETFMKSPNPGAACSKFIEGLRC